MIGIIAAMEEEMLEIKKIMKKEKENTIHGLLCLEGNVQGKPIVLVQGGVGKVNAARTAQILIDHYEIEYMVNVGSAGTSKSNIHIGDIVIGKRMVQHDFDITAFGHPKGYITGIGRELMMDEGLLTKYKTAIQKVNTGFQTIIGTIASGDIFCTDSEKTKQIEKEFDADAVEMEGAAIAQVCKLSGIPWVILRSISDVANGENAEVHEHYLQRVSERCAAILKEAIC